MAERPFSVELDEIAKIDYLLDNLARAVERGEVHRRSYDTMAPRYLARRAELVAFVTGVPLPPVPETRVAEAVATAAPTGAPVPGMQSSVAVGRAVPASVGPTVRATVDWPTVLLFLGAFLVVVASAIFSVAVWGSLGTLEKLGFLGALTLAFYAAGAWALKRLKLPVGAIALTAVASGMLLFDGWILIDGYQLEGPLPWAVLALVCSVAYFVTEALLAGRLFGVVGAAAQIAWWWLLGDGIGLTDPTRIAGIALVGLAWQLAGERGRGRPRVGPLAGILEWGAPLVAVLSGIGFLADLLVSGPATAQVVAASAVVSAATGITLWRSAITPRFLRVPLAAVAQITLLASAWSSAVRVGHEWWIVAAFVAAAFVYYFAAFRPEAVTFTVLGLFAEASAVLEVCLVLDLSPETTVTLIAALAAFWSLTARLLDRWSAATVAPFQTRLIALVVEVGSLCLLAVTSWIVPLATWTVPLPFAEVERVTALAYVGVLAAWWACSVARPRGLTSFAGTLWAYVTLSAVLSWALPQDYSRTLFTVPFVVLSGLWLAARSGGRQKHTELWGEISRWTARSAGLFFSALGLALASRPSLYTATPQGLEALGALGLLAAVSVGLFTLDALLSRCAPAAAVAAGLAVLAGSVGAAAVVGVWGPGERVSAAVLASGGVALVVSALALLVARRKDGGELAVWFALAGAGVGTVSVLDRTAATPLAASVAWGLLAVSWLLVASLTAQPVAAVAGLSLVVSVWRALGDQPSEWLSLIAVGATGLVLGAPSFFRVCRGDGRLRVAGLALALVGIGAHVHLAGSLPPDSHATAAALLLLAANAVAISVLWRFEPGYYAAGVPLVLTAWIEVGMLEGAPAVLYSLPPALYLVAVSYLFVRLSAERTNPIVLDAFATLVALAYPVVVTLRTVGDRSLIEALSTVALSLVAIALGVGLKARWYFFGGVAAVAIVAFYRSFWAIAEYWWLVLGVVGTAMLVVALTWQRQRLLVADARSWLARSFEDWR